MWALKEGFTEQDYLNFFKSKNWHIELTELRSFFFYKGEDISLKLYEGKIDDQAQPV